VLSDCFTRSPTLNRLRRGPAAPFLDGFSESLLATGYSVDLARKYLRNAVHLTNWAARRGVRPAALDEAVIERFLRHLPCRCHGRKHRVGDGPHRVDRFLKYLRQIGVVATPAASPLLDQYVGWMRQHQGLAEKTITGARPVVQAFLDEVEADLTRLDATRVRQFTLAYVHKHAPGSAKVMTSIIRCYLRYLVMDGKCAFDLIDAVPRVPSWRMTQLPRYLSDADVERTVDSCKRESSAAFRDHAVLTLLARLGLRAGDVAGLRLTDLDWQHGRIRVAGKSRRETRLPLPQDVGDAILAYIEHERPAVADDHVFFTARKPVQPMTTSNLGNIVRLAIGRAGVKAPSRGSHIFRHSLATRMLREGVSLETIGALLRHRSINTTAIYSKVDVAVLRQVAQPWPVPEVSPC
jgi:site-specific recombinase XerD